MRDAGYGVIVGFQMEEKIEQAYLYDFYGELLNEHQRRIYKDFVFNDLSLGEIADEEGISRQGVHDMVKRCTKTLEGYEEKLHLIAKFMSAKHLSLIHIFTVVRHPELKAVPVLSARRDRGGARRFQRRTFCKVFT